MYSEEYLRDLETSAHLYKQEQEKLMNVIEICPVCGRKYEKHWWRSPCCGVEMIWIENRKETTMEEDVKIDMTNEEAIKALQEFALNYGLNNKMIDAFGKAIRALEDQPCEDCISRQAVLGAMYALCDAKETLKENPWRDNPHIDAIIDTIDDLPSVTPQPKTGYWEQYGNSWEDKFKCSECGEEQPKILCGERIIGYWSDYCPNCGCRMKGESE